MDQFRSGAGVALFLGIYGGAGPHSEWRNYAGAPLFWEWVWGGGSYKTSRGKDLYRFAHLPAIRPRGEIRQMIFTDAALVSTT